MKKNQMKKNQMKKRMTAFLFTAAAAVCLTACGSAEGQKAKQQEGAENTAYTQEKAPTISEITPAGASISQHGVSFKVDKVEFAKEETRVYVTASNTSMDSFSMDVENIEAIQGGKTIAQTEAPESYEKLPEELVPGGEASGVLVFDPMDLASGFEIRAEGAGANQNVNFHSFAVEVQA